MPDDCIVGVGTGSTVNLFIEELAAIKGRIRGAVSSSDASTARLKAHHIPVYDLNEVDALQVYIDGADEINHHLHMIKGGGAALTREDRRQRGGPIHLHRRRKQIRRHAGRLPLPIEVIPMARSYVARELVKLGGHPELRQA